MPSKCAGSGQNELGCSATTGKQQDGTSSDDSITEHCQHIGIRHWHARPMEWTNVGYKKIEFSNRVNAVFLLISYFVGDALSPAQSGLALSGSRALITQPTNQFCLWCCQHNEGDAHHLHHQHLLRIPGLQQAARACSGSPPACGAARHPWCGGAGSPITAEGDTDH